MCLSWSQECESRPGPVLCVCSIMRASCGSVRESTCVVTMRGSWQADQPSCHPGWDPGLGGSQPETLPHLWTADRCEGEECEHTKPQDLHDTGNKRISKRNPSEVLYGWFRRNQRPQTRPMSHCYKHSQVKMYELKGTRCDTLSHTSCQAEILIFACLFCFVFLFFALLLNFGFFFCGGD